MLLICYIYIILHSTIQESTRFLGRFRNPWPFDAQPQGVRPLDELHDFGFNFLQGQPDGVVGPLGQQPRNDVNVINHPYDLMVRLATVYDIDGKIADGKNYCRLPTLLMITDVC